MLIAFVFVQLSSIGQNVKETTVYFELGADSTNSSETEKLNNWLNKLPDSILKIEVTGFADFVGKEEDNLLLSQSRSQNVISRIEQRTTPRIKLSLVNFRGEKNSISNGSTTGIPADRKVVVKAFLYPPILKSKTEAFVEKSSATVRDEESSATLKLTEVTVGESIILDNLNFHPGRHYLVPSALPELEKLIKVMKDNPSLEIEIQGHICCKLTADDGFDMNTRTYDLSANRAKYIFDQLVLAGISNSRMKHKGFAGTKPLIFPEKTDFDRNRNRRVEIQLLSK